MPFDLIQHVLGRRHPAARGDAAEFALAPEAMRRAVRLIVAGTVGSAVITTGPALAGLLTLVSAVAPVVCFAVMFAGPGARRRVRPFAAVHRALPRLDGLRLRPVPGVRSARRDRTASALVSLTASATASTTMLPASTNAGRHVTAYWPWIRPQPGSQAGCTPEPAGSFLERPVRAREAPSDIAFEEPAQSEPRGVSHPATFDEPRPERLVVPDVAKGERRLEVGPRYGGTRVHLARTDGGEVISLRTWEQRSPRAGG